MLVAVFVVGFGVIAMTIYGAVEFITNHTTALGVIAGIALAPLIVGFGIVALAALAILTPIALVVAAVVGIAYAVQAALSWVSENFSKFWKWITGIAADAVTWGTNIVDGLWKGIKDAWKGMIEGIKDLAGGLPDAVKKVLGIASPSKVMMELGMYTAAGF